MGLYCSSGAALAFAWRDYMPTFTDASLIAAGSGALLWAVLATEASSRRRTWAGLAGFVAIEIATFVRYTNIVILGCAVVTVIAAWRLRAARLPLRTLCWWLASVAVFGAGVAIFDDLVYGGPLTTGYQPGEVTFGLGAIGPNLRIMPAHLMQAMPMLVLGLIALAWIIVRWLVLRRADGEAGASARRDLCGRRRPRRVVVRDLGPVLRVHLDDRPDQRHRAGRQVLRSGDRRDRPARRLARDQDSRPCMASRPDLSRRHHGVVRPRRVVLPRHVRSVRRPTKRLGLLGGWRGLSPLAVCIRCTGEKSATKEDSMKYLLQNYPGSSVEAFEQLSADEQQAIVDEYLALRQFPGILTGEQLQPVEAATTVRVQNGETLLTDGPFVDAKEHVGGFIVVEADDLDVVLELAARVPAARMGGAVEVRPLVER